MSVDTLEKLSAALEQLSETQEDLVHTDAELEQLLSAAIKRTRALLSQAFPAFAWGFKFPNPSEFPNKPKDPPERA